MTVSASKPERQSLQYSETWSASESEHTFDFEAEKLTPSGSIQQISRLGHVIGQVTRDENDGWFSAETTAGRYIGQWESRQEAVEALAEWA